MPLTNCLLLGKLHYLSASLCVQSKDKKQELPVWLP